VLAGGFATLAHAPFQFFPAYAISLTLLIWLLDVAWTRPNRVGAFFSTGWWFGVGHFATGLYWLASAFLVDAEVFGVLAVPAVLALAGGLALFWGLGCAVARFAWTNDWRRLAVFAFALSLSELLRGHIFGGFPWLLPAYVWTPGEPLSQIASVIGVYGLSAWTLLLLAAPASIADRRFDAGKRFAPMIVAGLILGLAWGWGAQRIDGAPIEPPGAAPIVRVADSGMSQADKWQGRPDQEWRVLSRFLDASDPPETSDAQIVVWPEGAIPVVNFFPLENPTFLAALGRGLGDRALVTGLTRRALHGSEIVYFNSAAIIDGVSGRPRIDETQIYDKHRLVPFGEFIPLWSLVSRVNFAPLQRIGQGFEAGPAPTRRVIPDAPPAVILICYEAIFPGLIPRGEARPGWIISVTNDAWFGDLRYFTGPWQHYAMARYRSIEEGLPMARAASGGISAIIDGFGRPIRATNRAGGGVEAQLPPALPETALAQWGFLLTPLSLLAIALLRVMPATLIKESFRNER
jgi:apolipoprotein N-acyltransferase